MAFCVCSSASSSLSVAATSSSRCLSAAAVSSLSHSTLVLASPLSSFSPASSAFHSQSLATVSLANPHPSSSYSSSCFPASVSSSSFSSSSSSPSSSLLSSPFSVCVPLHRGVRVLTRVQSDQQKEKEKAKERADQKENIIKHAHLDAKLLPESNMSTRDILTKNLLNVPAIDAPYAEVFPNFSPTISKPAPWVRTEAELKKIQPIALPWKETSVRSGVIGRKMGMMHVWDHWGRKFPLTCIKIDSVVVSVRTDISPKSGLVGMELGSGFKASYRCDKPMMGHFKKAGLAPRHRLMQFLVTPDAVLPVGYLLTSRHFVPGQYVDVRGVTIGKGFQGGMKRWHFGGMPASHGVSKVHRHIGSTGNMGVAKVYKGKKMPGRMGGKSSTNLNLIVYKVDVPRNLVYVVGSIPGYESNYVVIRDAVKRKFSPANPPPFPTYVPKPNEEPVKEMIMPAPLQDPQADT